jgi:hypothetical protein
MMTAKPEAKQWPESESFDVMINLYIIVYLHNLKKSKALC